LIICFSRLSKKISLKTETIEAKQQGRSYRERRGRVGRYAPLLLKILFFLNAKIEKSTLSGVYNCSIYMNKDITPPCLGDPATPLRNNTKYEYYFLSLYLILNRVLIGSIFFVRQIVNAVVYLNVIRKIKCDVKKIVKMILFIYLDTTNHKRTNYNQPIRYDIVCVISKFSKMSSLIFILMSVCCHAKNYLVYKKIKYLFKI
jgi:hypothetical protein